MKNKSFIIISIVVLAILSVPFVAMQITKEVNWSVSDFLIMAILLFVTGFFVDLVLRNVKKLKYRLMLCTVLLLAFLLVWAELAVGIFGSPLAGS